MPGKKVLKMGKGLKYVFTMIAAMSELKYQELITAKQIREIQERKLRKIVKYAYQNVAYYRKLFMENGITPLDIRGLSDLKKIPYLTKDDIKTNYGDLLTREIEKQGNEIRYLTTTGSTGIPLKITLNTREYLYSHLLVRYGYLRSGVPLFGKLAYFQVPATPSKKAHYYEKADIFRQYKIDLREGPENNISELNRIKPEAIYGYPSYLFMVSKVLQDNNIKLLFKPKVVVTLGEILTSQVREFIGSVFMCPVHDTYGSTEFFRIAFECGHNSLHIIPGSVILEIDESTVDEEGSSEAVVTSLYHKTMPFIRYKLGDRIILSDQKCPCGSKFNTIKKVIGRADDYLILPSGKRISARAINILEDVPGIIEYQIIQREKDNFEVLVKPGHAFTEDSEKDIKNIIKAGCLGEDVAVKITKTNNLARAATGKLRAVTSEVAQ